MGEVSSEEERYVLEEAVSALTDWLLAGGGAAIHSSTTVVLGNLVVYAWLYQQSLRAASSFMLGGVHHSVQVRLLLELS